MANKSDYAHQSITTATNLLENVRIADLLGGHENTNNLSGWKGDATLKGDTGKVSFGPDDYIADLDAENIVYLMQKKGWDFQTASNTYYEQLGKEYTRSEMFLRHEDIKSVKEQILSAHGLSSMKELKKEQPDAYQFIKNLENKTNTLEVFK